MFDFTNKLVKRVVAFLLVGAMSIASIYVYADEPYEETTEIESVDPEINTEDLTEEFSETVDSEAVNEQDILEENIPEDVL